MPIGRFRNDPRELDDIEQDISAKQIPEASLMVGMGIGLVVPMAIVPDVAVAGALLSIAGGIVGYLIGFRYKVRRIERRRRQT